MPGHLIELGAQVKCQHAGLATPMQPNPRVRVGGRPTNVVGSQWTVAGCSLASSSGPFCATATWLIPAPRLTSGRRPIVLNDSASTAQATGSPLFVAQTQKRVRGSQTS
jgi:hypothetical protein